MKISNFCKICVGRELEIQIERTFVQSFCTTKIENQYILDWYIRIFEYEEKSKILCFVKVLWVGALK